jgi:eukaryotic-like serine/threonine-protein kinase
VLHDTPARLRSLREDAPAGLERALMLALRKRPEERPQTILELAKELAPFGSLSARESLARIEVIKPVSPEPPRPTRRRAAADSVTRTLTAWGSRILDMGAVRSGRQALALRLALASAAALALAFGAIQLLRPASEAKPATPTLPPAPVSSPAPAQTSRPPPPSPATSSPPVTIPAPSSGASVSAPAFVKKRTAPRPIQPPATASVPPVAAPPTPAIDPYLHRK